jgi:hypothetical protein
MTADLKIIRISTIDANNEKVVNERAERSGRNQCWQQWRQVAKSRGFVMRVREKLYIIASSGFPVVFVSSLAKIPKAARSVWPRAPENLNPPLHILKNCSVCSYILFISHF